MKNLLISVTSAALLAGLAMAQDTGAKSDMKQAGSDMKQAGNATGRAAKHTGRAVKKGTKKGVHKAAGATESGAAAVKDKTTP